MEIGYVFLVGLVLAFGISIPVGPINIICVQRTLAEGRRAGLAAGLGAAVADSIYGLVAVLGLSLVAPYIEAYRTELRVIGGLVLLALGSKMIYDAYRQIPRRRRPQRRSVVREYASHVGAFLSTFVLTLTNPFTVIAFGAMFATLGIAERDLSRLAEGSLVLGVFVGASLWWLTLVMIVAAFRRKLTVRWMVYANRIAAVAMTLFGLFVLFSPLVMSPRNGGP